jgi:hypothetical protein
MRWFSLILSKPVFLQLFCSTRLPIAGTHRRIRSVGYDILGTMKALFSIFLAFGLCVGSVHSAQGGPVRTARNVAKSTAITAKNVAHSTVRGTRRAVHTVVNTFTP